MGSRTGVAGIDRVIEALETDDAVRLEQLFVLHETACSTAQGLGGPPPCRLAPAGSAPDGTPVRAFPISSCELGWVSGVTSQVRELVERETRLHSVVEFAAAPLTEPFLPRSTHAIILEGQSPGGSQQGIMLHIRDGNVVYLDHVCGGPPEDFATSHPLYRGKMRVILRGPAYK